MMAWLAAILAAVGTHHLCVDHAHRSAPEPTVRSRPARVAPIARLLTEAGLHGVRARDLVVTGLLSGLGTAVATSLVLGPTLPAVVAGLAAAAAPAAALRRRRANRRAVAQEAWPRLLEEVRLQTAALGRSVPQALFDVGQRSPMEMRVGFAAAHREWLMTTDLERSLQVLKDDLTDPTADAACETLLVAHEVGGGDLGRRLEALAEDRLLDLQGRKDARARQAGARFARRFVLLTPAGMAVAGMSVGDGRAAFRTPTGQGLSLIAVLMTIGCWVWASRILHLPEAERVFP